MVQKEKQVKSYTRKSKSGKQVQVKSYSAKYNSAEDMVKEALKQKKGAGKELLETKKKQKVENIPGYDFSMDDFAHWYEGDGSKQDKAVEKSLRKILGRKNYEALNDYVADNYKKNGYKLAFKKVNSFKEGVTTKDSKPKSAAAKKRDSTITKLEKKLKTKGSLTNAEADALNKAKTAKRMGKDEYSAKDYVDFVNGKTKKSSNKIDKSGKSQGIPLSGFKPRQQSLINSKLQKNGSYSEEWHTTHGIDMGYTLTLNKLEKSGWKRKSHKVSPEDRLSTNSVYISPDGKYKAIAITSGDILRKNHHQSIEIKKV